MLDVSNSPEAAAIIAEANSKYVHWDEFRHRYSPPPGLALADVWAAARLQRRATRQAIPLLTPDDRPFSFNLPGPVHENLTFLDRFVGPAARVNGDGGDGPDRPRYLVNSLMEEAITSSQIEGAAVTLVQAKEMLRAGRRPRNQSEKMVLNNYETMRRLKEMRTRPLTVEQVHAIHRTITEGALEKADAAGRFRRADERVDVVDNEDNVLYTPPPAGQLPERMERLCAFANETGPATFLHPVVRAMLLHFWLAYDHPYVDGNGRTARALFYWSMLRSGYDLVEFVSISSVLRESYGQYRDAFLYAESDEEDATYFLVYHAKVLRRAIERLHEYVRRQQEENAEMLRQLAGYSGLNARQHAMLRHALRHPTTIFTYRSHATSHDVTHATARKDLLALAALGLLEQRKRGKEFTFMAAQDLAARLGDAGGATEG